MAHATAHFFGSPSPLGPWGGAKRSNIIKSQLLIRFQRFLNQTLCVFSQMKDIKKIRRDSFPRLGHVLGVGLGGTLGGWGGQFFLLKQPLLVCELLT